MTPPEDRFRTDLGRLGPVGPDLLKVDWAGSPLGLPEQWPASLQTTVTTLLTSRFSMWMAWGPELTFFCNDAYRRATLGVKYPWALGKPAGLVWQEIWPEIGPRIERVIAAGEATWDERLLLFLERSGYVEETYHTFSYSPLRDDEGRTAGMLCVVTEETEQVISRRHLAMLRGLSASSVSLNTEQEVLATVGQQLGSDLRSLPFTLGYVFDRDSGAAHLAWTSGISASHPAAPPVIDPGDDTLWPVADLTGARSTTLRLDDRYGELPAGAWPEPPTAAVVVALTNASVPRPYGFMVVGMNRYRPLDREYRSFVELVADQVTAAIGSSRSFEAERYRAEQLAALDAAKSTFFTNVSHELRTPLTLLLGPTADLLADPDHRLSDRQRRSLEVIARNAERLLHLVNTLLDFQQLESGSLSGRFEPVDLAHQTRELVHMFDEAVERAGLELVTDLTPLPEPVYVDREMWAKIVLNLLSNALKCTFEGSITVRLSGGPDGAELAVSDTGIGIPVADQTKLFERFQRVDGARSRSHEGSGIGLALVAELSALQGGAVHVESTEGVGSTFVVRLPFGSDHLPPDQVVGAFSATAAEPEKDGASVAARALVDQALGWVGTDTGSGSDTGSGAEAAPGSDTASGADAVPATTTSRQGPATGQPDEPSFPEQTEQNRLLVVEDNADMRDYLVGLLGGLYVVDATGDGAAALARCRTDPPDLVLTDVMMPNLNGFELLAALRADPATCGIPVVMLSARAGEEGRIEGLEAGADDYVSKPFSGRELLARIHANLEMDRVRRTRDQLRRSQELMDQAQHLARVGSWQLDFETGRTSASAELLHQLQITHEELEAAGLEQIVRQFVHPHDLPVIESAIGEARLGRPLDYEVRLRLRDGQVRTFHARSEVHFDPEGRPVGLRGTNQDVTEQRAEEWRLAEESAAKEVAAREHRIAEELQASLLPAHEFDPERLEVATLYRSGMAGTQVGGDWYDVIDIGGGRTALVMGDVMGRGVQAAAVMGQLRSAVRAYAHLDLPPAQVLESLDGLVRELGGDQIATCIYANYDPTKGLLTWANAGHLPPLLARPDREVARLGGPGDPPLGAGPLTLVQRELELPPGAILALYTDGLIERRYRDLDAGIDLLANQLAKLEGHLRGFPQALADSLLESGPDDDVALLLARVPDELAQPLTATISVPAYPPAVSEARGWAARTLAEWDLPPDQAPDILLVVSELVTNAVLHGQAPIDLRLSYMGRELIIEVADRSAAPPRRLRTLPEDERGRGLHLVASLSSRWGTRPTRTGKTVWCTFGEDVLAPSAV